MTSIQDLEEIAALSSTPEVVESRITPEMIARLVEDLRKQLKETQAQIEFNGADALIHVMRERELLKLILEITQGNYDGVRRILRAALIEKAKKEARELASYGITKT